jgi:hypothetical protein
MSIIQPLPNELRVQQLLEIITGYAHSPAKVQALWGAQNPEFAAAARANWRSDYFEITEKLPEKHFVRFLNNLRPDIERSLFEEPTHERQILVAQKVKKIALTYIHNLIRIVQEIKPDFKVPRDLDDCSYTQMDLCHQEIRDYLLLAAFEKIFEWNPLLKASVALPEDSSDTQKATHIRNWLDSASSQPEVQNQINRAQVWLHRLQDNFSPELLRFRTVSPNAMLTLSIRHRQWHTVCAALQSPQFDREDFYSRFKEALDNGDPFVLQAFFQYGDIDENTRRGLFRDAARDGREDIVQEMLEYWEISENDLSQILREWIDKHGSTRLIKIVLQKHIFNPKTLGLLAMHASFFQNWNAITSILESGQTIDPELLGQLLDEAVTKRNSNIYKSLLHSHREIDLVSLGKALASGVKNEDLEAVEMILNGDNELFRRKINATTLGWALGIAADKGNLKIVQAILNSNRRIDSRRLTSALETAMEKRHREIARLILRSGREMGDDILLQIHVTAAAERDIDLFVEFLEKGPRMSPEDLGKMLVHVAFRQNSRAVQAILNSGQLIPEAARLRARTCAERQRNQEIIALLDGPPAESLIKTVVFYFLS